MKYAALLLLLLSCNFSKSDRDFEEDSEVVLLPFNWSENNEVVPLTFRAFGRKIDLLLKRNHYLLSPSFEVWKYTKEDYLRKLEDYSSTLNQYIYKDANSSAAINLYSGKVSGFVYLENDSLEITPMNENDQSDIFKNQRIQVRSRELGEPHVIKRRRLPSRRETFAGRKKITPRFDDTSDPDALDAVKPMNGKTATVNSPLTLELAVFLDAEAYRLFDAYLEGNEAKLVDLLLAYVNNIQALFYHPSLGRELEIALVRLELFEKQPTELGKLDGERNEMLEAFCSYSDKQNPRGDENPRHWDMGIYISGMDFYSVENGEKNTVTMGLAPVGGVCWTSFSCVIAEFGVSNRFGRPYPSAGFTSVYIAAHEIGHNLGMHHDASGNDCPKDGYIMSASRGTIGETYWSSCSRELALTLHRNKSCLLDGQAEQEGRPHHLDHNKIYLEAPGRKWTAKHQCEILLRDGQAYVEQQEESVCRALRCRSPSKEGFYLAGPALDGTECDEGKECKAGDCLPIRQKWQEAVPATSWSPWSSGICLSGCIRGSLGFVERRRSCLGGSADCPGLSFDVALCKDSEVCAERKRISALEHASYRCLEFSRRLDLLDGRAGGLQAEHERLRPWLACAIFCKRKDIASYYSPRLELNDLGLDPYFPDGTWCHRGEDGEDYYCRRHHCLPENFRFGKGLPPPPTRPSPEVTSPNLSDDDDYVEIPPDFLLRPQGTHHE